MKFAPTPLIRLNFSDPLVAVLTGFHCTVLFIAVLTRLCMVSLELSELSVQFSDNFQGFRVLKIMGKSTSCYIFPYG